MNEEITNELATPTPVAANPMDHSFDIGNGTLANTSVAAVVEPLYAIKAKQLAEVAKQKEIALVGVPAVDPNIGQQTLDEILYGATDGNNQTDDGYLKQFGSGVQTLLADTADLATTGGAYIMKGVDNLAGGNGDIYSQQDFDTATNFFDQFSGENADKMWGYDRTRLNEQQKAVMTSINDGNYMDAAVKAVKASPGTIVDSLPVMLSMLIGVGEVKAVQVAGTKALQIAKASGMSVKATKAAVEASKQTARKQLAIHTKLLNVSRNNAGLINYSNIQTQQQIEELTKNGGDVNAGDVARIWATNVFMNSLDKMAFKDIVKFKSAPVSKELWGKLDKASKFGVAKQIVKTLAVGAKNMGQEGLQEYVQTWGEIVNSNWGAKDTKNFLDVFNKEKNLEALTAMFLGAGAGLTMGAPSQLNGLRQGLNKEGSLDALYNNPKKNIDAGYATTEDQIKHTEKLDANYEEAKTNFDTLSETEEVIRNINSSDSDNFNKVTSVQAALHNESQATDSSVNQLATQFGNKETKQVLDMIIANEALASKLDEATINDIISSPGSEAFQKVGSLLAGNADSLTPEIKEAYNQASISLQEQADTIVNSGGTQVSYENAKAQLNQVGSVNKSTADYAKTKQAPINGKANAFS